MSQARRPTGSGALVGVVTSLTGILFSIPLTPVGGEHAGNEVADSQALTFP